jgi:hypothetical protein
MAMHKLIAAAVISLAAGATSTLGDELTAGTYHCVASPEDPAMTGDIVIAGNTFSSGGVSGTYDYDASSGQLSWNGTPTAGVMDDGDQIKSSNATGSPGGDQEIYFFSHWGAMDSDMVVACSP